MRKKNLFLLLFIIVIGFCLRAWHLDKPEGLWNDEYIGWFISSRSFPVEFFQETLKNCHMPLYYLFLKVWIGLFGDADISLRWSSVFCGLPSILAMYFVGKTYKDEKLGLFCAAFSAVSGFLIYFSQEVRLYSLLFLISSCCLLAWLNLAKNQSKRNFLIFGLTNFLIIITHTIGFIFVFFNILGMGIYLASIDKKYVKPMQYIVGIVILTLIPIIPFFSRIVESSFISQFWSGFSFSKVYFVFSDYFSAIQINIINTPNNIIDIFYKGSSFNYMFLIFALVPMTISLIFVIKSLFTRDSKLKYLASIGLLYFLVLIGAAFLNRIVLATKYSVEIYPVLILMLGAGIFSLKKESMKKLVITILIVLPLIHYTINNNSTPKLGRSEGNKIVIDMLRFANIKETDKVLLTYYSADKFEKYFDGKKYQFYSIDKYNFPSYIVNESYTYKTIVINGKILFYENLKNNDTRLFEQKFYNTFIKDMKKGDKLAIVLLKNVSFFDEKQMKEITSNYVTYHKTPFLFMVFSYVKNNSISIAKKYLKLQLITEGGDWVLVVFEKTN